nr:reverse transcriptase domain-containing protein [Tanacetum cinerariifolium]
MKIFIKEFRTTNELLLKEQSNLLSELKIKVNELSKFMSNVLIPKNKVNGVTTRGGKMTSEATSSKEINKTRINENKPLRFKQDVQEKPHDDGVKNKSSSIIFRLSHYPFNYPTRRLTIEEILDKFIDEGRREHEEMKIFIKEFRTTNELLLKEQSNLLSELKIKVLTEREIADKFFDEYLMVLNPSLITLNHDNIMRRCVAGSKTLEILAHCHSGPTGRHHSANVTAKKVYESKFYCPSVFKDAN